MIEVSGVSCPVLPEMASDAPHGAPPSPLVWGVRRAVVSAQIWLHVLGLAFRAYGAFNILFFSVVLFFILKYRTKVCEREVKK